MQKLTNKEVDCILKNLMINDLKEFIHIGEGAWHEVYRMKTFSNQDFVIRIKKEKAYNQLQTYTRENLITEYESSKTYYNQANKCIWRICPTEFNYFIDEEIVFNVESFMGSSLPLHSLGYNKSLYLGQLLGEFYKGMHDMDTMLKGYGNLVWNENNIEGKETLDIQEKWEQDNAFYLKALEKLSNSELTFNRKKVELQIQNIISMRRKKIQKISLVNQDVTPENIVFHEDNVSIIDPYPRLDFDVKYAGYFYFCYKLLLPSYSNAPRYIDRGYDSSVDVLSSIAEGFVRAYAGDDHSLYKRLTDEYLLWILLEIHEHYLLLKQEDLSYKVEQQMGNEDILKQRMEMYLKELEKLIENKG
ncbi:hypothetical protein [Bacillus wiedmannii]|uniref:Uncharacterized protein n=1 Tax=Bacillus wiedmannii TaxID=1890302 RepID=A0A242ZB56_9BACI|nr:hypothetical protein [Bacillus wiedmannii]OUB41467.1 hypothetical protein BK740_18370 [Bacillus thuringiensis serovar argentinensis]MCU5500892.1 hypothetical protein [Bacillus wiedmannii]MDP1456076.1 hypothetical protein [Bacillus wiedmannii]MED3122685.1 hypothetical protein [Bacillus wiedmannii]OTX90082.1 hypothetical protein BK730_11950 [Bacillus wiedmannii]